jgi:uncharacterized protein with von Willebrand factor type A (vWA) domain
MDAGQTSAGRAGPAATAGSLAESEQELVRLEQLGHLEEALALCERVLAEHAFPQGEVEAERLEAQLNQRRLRLRRKLRLPTWSSQGTPY